MITVNTNMASIIAQNSFNKCSNAMNKALGRLSTGYKINSAKDDAAGSAIAAKLETKISSYAQATKNAEMGADYLQSADSTLSTMQSMVQRMRDLTEQAANGTYGDDERKAIQSEINGLTKELYRIKNTTEFNGKKILGEEDAPIISESDAEAQGYTVVKTAKELKDALKSNDPSCKVMLFGDIDLNDLPIDATGSNWTAVTDFKGTFDGNGNTIKNLKSSNGLFSRIENATLKNINMENIDITGAKEIGGLVGTATSSTIENCVLNNVKITGGSSLGGLVGRLVDSKAISCEALNVDIKDGDGLPSYGYDGGLIAVASNGSKILNCASSGSIKSSGYNIAGLVGVISWQETNTISIENCYTACTIDSSAANRGGFIGDCNQVVIKNCVSASKPVQGGSISAFYGGGLTNAKFEDCLFDKIAYPTGSEQGNDTIGRIKAANNPASPVEESKEEEGADISVMTNLQVGIQADELSTISIDTGFAIGNFKVDVSTDEKAQKSLAKIDKLLDKMTSKRTDIGASLNRLDSVMAQQETMRTSMTSALSQIKDADIAKESANYVKNQILQQTTASLLATANQNPNIALNLL